jgi:RNA ligase.
MIDMTNLPPFEAFAKIPRLKRHMVITEKLDGTNAQVYISEDKQTVLAGSRNRWLAVTDDKRDDNYDFAAWVKNHRDELVEGLGPGRHYGEWYGMGINRRYGLSERRFALFNVSRWKADNPPPKCCSVVPLLYSGSFGDGAVAEQLDRLRTYGSAAVPGFMKPEGIVIFHAAAGGLFKVTLENDEMAKGNAEQKEAA